MQKIVFIMALTVLCVKVQAAEEEEKKSAARRRPYEVLQTTLVTLPSAAELSKRLCGMYDDCFSEKQNLIGLLNGRKLPALSVAAIVDVFWRCHEESEDSIIAIAAMRARRLAVFKKIFYDRQDVVSAVEVWIGRAPEDVIRLPDAEALNQQLIKKGLGGFMAETGITTCVGEQEYSLLELGLRIDDSLYDRTGQWQEHFHPDIVRRRRRQAQIHKVVNAFVSHKKAVISRGDHAVSSYAQAIQRLEAYLQTVHR